MSDLNELSKKFPLELPFIVEPDDIPGILDGLTKAGPSSPFSLYVCFYDEEPQKKKWKIIFLMESEEALCKLTAKVGEIVCAVWYGKNNSHKESCDDGPKSGDEHTRGS